MSERLIRRTVALILPGLGVSLLPVAILGLVFWRVSGMDRPMPAK